MRRCALRLMALVLAWGGVWPGAVQAARFAAVVPEHSRIGLVYSQMGVNVAGQFKRFAADLVVDTDHPEQSKGWVDINVASIDVGSDQAHEEVLGPAWFHVAAHPKARFVLTGLKPSGPNQYEASGTLTIKGQTRLMRLPVSLSPQGDLSGRVVVKRADFALGQGMWAGFDVIANEVTVNFKLKLQ